jgi:hypothetical protein
MDSISSKNSSDSNRLANSYLLERGITEATAEAFGLEIEARPTFERFKERLLFTRWDGKPLPELIETVIWFPGRDADGNTVSWTARVFPTLGEVKFLTQSAAPPFPFIPQATWAARQKINKPIVFSEGPVKALAIWQARQLPVGLGGVWMATKKGTDGSVELVPTLREFHWSSRLVYLAFDADYKTNPNVRQGLFRTFFVLYKQGAKVRFLSWPMSEGKGIDDYLHAKKATGETAATALGKLIESACEIGKLITPEDLTIVQNELTIAKLSGAQLSQLSKILSDPLKVRASALEEDATREQAAATARGFTLTDPEPWLDPVNGAQLLNQIVALLQRYVIMNDAAAIAVALWVLLTFLDAHVDVLPILAVTSPQKRCGKTTLLTILSQLTRRPLPASSISSAALYRCIEKFTPCLLIDEADTFLKDNVELKGLLNSGHTRRMAKVIRINVDTMEPEEYSTWAPKAIACIGKLSETLTDRAIEIRLQRRTHAESIQKLRDGDPETFARYQRQAMRWALDNGDRVRQARPAIPSVLNDRAGDNWFPLLQIASTTGFDGAANAALALNADQSDENIALLLLTALRDIFNEAGLGFLPTETILERLNDDKEAPWSDWKNGMTAERTGKSLRAFGVKSEQRQESGERHRGYSRKSLQAVFDRYLSPFPLLPPENVAQRVHLSADQVSEPLGSAQVQGTQPGHAQAKDFNPCAAEPLPEPIHEEVHRIEAKSGDGESKEDLNGSSFKEVPLKNRWREPSLTSNEKRLIDALAPYDYDGGLQYEDWREKTGLLEESFAREIQSLLRRGFVFRSPLNHNYQFKTQFAETRLRLRLAGDP